MLTAYILHISACIPTLTMMNFLTFNSAGLYSAYICLYTDFNMMNFFILNSADLCSAYICPYADLILINFLNL